MSEKTMRKGIKVHIFNLNQQEEINACLATVRLSEHGVQIVPGTFFASGKITIFENLLPLEEVTTTVGKESSDLLGPIAKNWATGQDMLLKLDSLLSYMMERKGKGSHNTRNTWEKDYKARMDAREQTLSKMAICKREAELVMSGRYPALELTKDGAKAYGLPFELPELSDVEEEQIYAQEEPKKGARQGS